MRNLFRCRWRVRRLRRVGHCDWSYHVEYRIWWWPFWWFSSGFHFKSSAIQYAQERFKDEEIIKIS